MQEAFSVYSMLVCIENVDQCVLCVWLTAVAQSAKENSAVQIPHTHSLFIQRLLLPQSQLSGFLPKYNPS